MIKLRNWRVEVLESLDAWLNDVECLLKVATLWWDLISCSSQHLLPTHLKVTKVTQVACNRIFPDKGFRHDYLLLCHRAGAQGGGAEWCWKFVWQRLPAVHVFFNRHQATPFEMLRLPYPRHGVDQSRMHRPEIWQPVGHTKTRRPRSKCQTSVD